MKWMLLAVDWLAERPVWVWWRWMWVTKKLFPDRHLRLGRRFTAVALTECGGLLSKMLGIEGGRRCLAVVECDLYVKGKVATIQITVLERAVLSGCHTNFSLLRPLHPSSRRMVRRGQCSGLVVGGRRCPHLLNRTKTKPFDKIARKASRPPDSNQLLAATVASRAYTPPFPRGK